MGAGDRGISPAAGRRSGGGRPVKSSVGATGTSAPPPAAHFRLSATGGDTDATWCAARGARVTAIRSRETSPECAAVFSGGMAVRSGRDGRYSVLG